MESTVTGALLLGFVLGLKHAVDPDHLVAISTMVSEHRSLTRSSIVGTLWGLGHTASLLAIGLAVILLKTPIPPRVASLMEMAVAVMLVALGTGVIVKVLRDPESRVHYHTHRHDGGPEHSHLHVHIETGHKHSHHPIKIGRKPFVVGLVHGVAGSAALTLLVLTTIPSAAIGLAYIALFGIGSVGGMLLMSTLVGLPFIATARRLSSLNVTVRVIAGLSSVVFGLALGWEILESL
jgi:ABC-type nickel/cobalt efflux system permease component RcnA